MQRPAKMHLAAEAAIRSAPKCGAKSCTSELHSQGSDSVNCVYMVQNVFSCVRRTGGRSGVENWWTGRPSRP